MANKQDSCNMNYPQEEKSFFIHPCLSIEFITPKNESYFFGYYNYSPINKDHNKVLAHRVTFEGRMPESNDTVEIGYFDLYTNEWNPLGISQAFNWQQGSMLQWLGPDFNKRIIYNDVETGKYIARIYDLEKGLGRTISKAIYGVDPNGEFSISLNFERSYWTRAYSYSPICDDKWNVPIPEKDGILLIDLKTGKYKTIIKLKNILDIGKVSDEKGVSHWVEHIMLNPSGNRFAFYHRYGNNCEYTGRVYTADINGENIWAHPFQAGDSLSHLGWINSASYVLFTNPEAKIISIWKSGDTNKRTQMLKKLYRKYFKSIIPRKIVKSASEKNSFYAITIDQKGVSDKLNDGVLKQDGHPSFTSDSRFMLTDTYADGTGFRHLVLYDFQKSKVIQLGKFFSTFNKCGWRADLHPRFSYDEKSIIIDSTQNGYHQVLVLKVDWDKII